MTMVQKTNNRILAYTYELIRIKDKKRYYGVRTCRNIYPEEDLGVRYFSSGTFKREFKRFPSKFKFRIDRKFYSFERAREYETKYIKRVLLEKKFEYVNKGAWPMIIFDKNIRDKISKAMKGRFCGVDNPFFGKQHSKETKKKISKRNSGRELTDVHRKAIVKSNRTRVYSKETLEKLSKINKGRKFGKEFREKISKAKTGSKLSKQHKINIGNSTRGKKNGMFGRTHSAETRRKISTTRKDNPNCYKSSIENLKRINKKGRTPWNKGKKYSIKKSFDQSFLPNAKGGKYENSNAYNNSAT